MCALSVARLDIPVILTAFKIDMEFILSRRIWNRILKFQTRLNNVNLFK